MDDYGNHSTEYIDDGDTTEYIDDGDTTEFSTT